MKKHLKRHVEMEGLFGADTLPLGRRAPSAAKKPVKGPPLYPWEQNWPADFQAFRAVVLECTKCGLCKGRTQVVFGTGPLKSPLMFVGEAPGQDEDRKGEPFVGRAGQLLTTTLKGLGVERSRVFITNIVKCRPPDNRTPQPDEMAACMPWLTQQIATIQPKLICALGNIAAQTLLNTKTGITKLRGKVMGHVQAIPIFPTFHPAYILRNMSDLPLFEADLKQACRTTGLIP